MIFFFFQAEDGIRDLTVTGVQTCALPISSAAGDGAATVGAGALACAARRTRRRPWLGLAVRAGRLRRRDRRASRSSARRCRSVRLDAFPVEAAPAGSADALRRLWQRNRGCAAALAAAM